MRFEGSEHRRCSLWLHSDNTSIRIKFTECRDQATHEPSASDRTEDDVRTHIPESFIDLESDTSLPGDDTLIIEWMDEYRARRFLVLFRLSKCIIEGISDENNFYVFSTELLGFIYLLLGGQAWHEDLSIYSEFCCTVSNSLGMIARTRCDNTSFFLWFRETRHTVIGSTDLIWTNRSEIFAFELDLSIIEFRQPFRVFERSRIEEGTDFFLSSTDGVERNHRE